MNKPLKTNRIMRTLLISFAFTIFTSMVIGAEEVESKLANDLSIKFRMENNQKLLLEIANTTTIDQHLNSNIKGIMDFKFLNFPTRGAMQFKSSSGEILDHKSTKNGWIIVCAYSSQADPPDKAMGLKHVSEITIPAHSFLAFPIDYDGAVKIAKSEFKEKDQIPSDFRVKLVVDVMESGKLVSKEIISDWFVCSEPP